MTLENVSPGRETEKKSVGVELRLDAAVHLKPVFFFFCFAVKQYLIISSFCCRQSTTVHKWDESCFVL